MTTYTWKGSRGLVSNPNDWTPTGVPAYGDTAVITQGTAFANGPHEFSGVNVDLGNPNPADAPTLQLVNAGVPPSKSAALGRPPTPRITPISSPSAAVPLWAGLVAPSWACLIPPPSMCAMSAR
jgi:hypothetical protein